MEEFERTHRNAVRALGADCTVLLRSPEEGVGGELRVAANLSTILLQKGFAPAV